MLVFNGSKGFELRGPHGVPSTLPPVLEPLRRLAAWLLPAMLAGALLAGCGGGDDESVAELLDRAFGNPIGSAEVKLDVEVELRGVEELEDPIEITLTGPYRSGGDDQIPSVDWDLTVSAQNQSFNAGLTSTGTRAFVAFQGTEYEVSRATVAALNRQVAQGNKREDGQNLSDFGVNAREWIVDAKDEGGEEVAGAETTHVSGKLDVGRVLEDLNKIVAEAAKLRAQTGGAAPPELTGEQKRQVEEVVDDPGFDAYVGKDDETLHRLSADIDFDVPEDSRDRVGGLEGGRISFSIEFADIGGDMKISAPKDARPIAELTEQLRGLLGGALGGQLPGDSAAPDDSGGGAQTDPEKRKAYEDCVKTDPSDPQVKAFCEVLLQ
jgi:hypothetical protein